MNHLKKMKEIVDQIPPSEDHNWWQSYLWYRFQGVYLYRVMMVSCAVWCFSPNNLIQHIGFALFIASFLVFLGLRAVRERKWNKKFNSEKEDDFDEV